MNKDLKSDLTSVEAEFRQVLMDATKKINEHLAKAKEEFEKAVDVSERTGVPFTTDLVMDFMTNEYTPRTFSELEDKFQTLLDKNEDGQDEDEDEDEDEDYEDDLTKIRTIVEEITGINAYRLDDGSGFLSESWSSSSLMC